LKTGNSGGGTVKNLAKALLNEGCRSVLVYGQKRTPFFDDDELVFNKYEM
jgi:hypothetical protein